MSRMNENSLTYSCLAAAVCLAILSALAPRLVYHWDEVQLALAVDRIDLAFHQPHPPGYYLFIVLSRPLAHLAGDRPPGELVSCGFAVVAAAFIGALLPPDLSRTSRIALATAVGLFFGVSPLVWHYAVAGLTYVAEGTLWLLLSALVAREGRLASVRRGLVLGAAIGLAAGFRPTLLLGAGGWAAVKALRARSFRGALGLTLGAGLGVGAWLIPFVHEAGGWALWREATTRIAIGNVWEKSVFAGSTGAVLAARLPVLAADLAEALGPWLAVVAVAAGLRLRGRAVLAPLDPFLVATVLALGFYTLVSYDTSGCAISAVIPAFAYGVGALAILAPRRAGRVALLLVASQLVLPGGYLAPTSRLAERGERDASLAARFAAVREALPPTQTVLVTREEYWAFAFRHVMYYLPEYETGRSSATHTCWGSTMHTPTRRRRAGRRARWVPPASTSERCRREPTASGSWHSLARTPLARLSTAPASPG